MWWAPYFQATETARWLMSGYYSCRETPNLSGSSIMSLVGTHLDCCLRDLLLVTRPFVQPTPCHLHASVPVFHPLEIPHIDPLAKEYRSRNADSSTSEALLTYWRDGSIEMTVATKTAYHTLSQQYGQHHHKATPKMHTHHGSYKIFQFLFI